jgi:hypothetical protein
MVIGGAVDKVAASRKSGQQDPGVKTVLCPQLLDHLKKYFAFAQGRNNMLTSKDGLSWTIGHKGCGSTTVGCPATILTSSTNRALSRVFPFQRCPVRQLHAEGCGGRPTREDPRPLDGVQ